LPPLDTDAIDAFWARYLASVGESPGSTYGDALCFGDHVEMADELLALILDGPKRATAGSVAEYEHEGAPLPEVGDRWIACDGRGVPRAVLRATDVRVGPLSSVDGRFAWDEGEGDRSLEYWLAEHTRFFQRTYAELGLPFGPDIPIVFERFEIAYTEPRPA
jgi:uncharacterized protein YhfF